MITPPVNLFMLVALLPSTRQVFFRLRIFAPGQVLEVCMAIGPRKWVIHVLFSIFLPAWMIARTRRGFTVIACIEGIIFRMVELLQLESLTGEFQRPAVLRHRPNDVIWCAPRNLGFDLQCNCHLCPDQSDQMGDDLIRYLPGIEAHAHGVERDASVKSPGSGYRRWS